MKIKTLFSLYFLALPMLWANSGIDEYRMGRFKEAAKLLLAEKNLNAYAQYYLGEMNLYGYGVPRNQTMAIRYFGQSAQADYLPALQMMARYTLLMEKNPQKALEWFKKAANQKDLNAMMYCAAAYQFGYGVQANIDLARHYYIEAAKQGNARAQYYLAQYFLNPQKGSDKRLGSLWLEKAAKNGDELALVYKANVLHQQKEFAKGQDVLAGVLKKEVPQALKLQADWFLEKNELNQAHYYLLKAAKKAYPAAQFALGEFYLKPNTPFYHADYGFTWILLAAQHHDTKAKAFLEKATLTPEQTEKLKELSLLEKNPVFQRQAVAMRLSANRAYDFDFLPYRLKGIWSDWRNKDALAQERLNAYPKFFQLTIKELFKPNYQWVEPKDISLHEYLDAINQLKGPVKPYQGSYPNYLEALPRNYADLDIKKLNHQAYLGVASSQFQLATCYEFGWHLKKNLEKARHWYKQAMAQDYLQAEYQLALLELTGDKAQIEKGKAYLRDAAFKGDVKAAFTLGLLNETQDDAQLKEAKNMLMLAAVNGSGVAQFRLAEWLSREPIKPMSIKERQQRDKMLGDLYRGAFEHGIQEAALPLAYYEALSSNAKNREWAMHTALSYANQGNDEAAILLGLMIEKENVQSHQGSAKQWFSQAKNHPIGAFIWSNYVRDEKEKQDLLEKAAQANFSYAYLNLGILKAQNQQEPFADLQKASDMNNLKAKHLLANLLVLDGQANLQQQARQVFRDMAVNGDAEAQWKLGYLMSYGLGGNQDATQGQIWLEKSAQELPLAQFVLAYLHHMGQFNGQPDDNKAKYWFEKASKQLPKAAIALGYLYEMVDKNYKFAMQSYEKVREQERILANYNIALMYEYGKGIEPNYFKAKRYFISAAESGSAAAMFKLANMYQMTGFSMTANEYMKKAASKGHRPAIAALQ